MNLKKSKAKRTSRQPSSIQITIDKIMENVEYLKYLGCIITNEATYTRENKSKIAMGKPSFKKKETLFIRKFGLN
jgi:hypothetical protein